MTEFPCGYGDDRDEAIVAFLYDDPDASQEERGRFETHLVTCARCEADIAALERQLKGEIRAAQTSTTSVSPTAVKTAPISASDAEVIRRVRALVDESEKRQQRELALRVAELARDVTAQRQADLVKID